jgi:Holliday junction resolvase RusA-like endonuclease
MVHTFTIKGRLPDLNDYLQAERVSRRTPNGKFFTRGAEMKKKWQQYIITFIRKDLKRLKITKPVIIHYHYYEPNARRDYGNIHAVAQKFIEDALQITKVLANDNQKCVRGFTADFDIDKDEPRIVVEIEEVEQ